MRPACRAASRPRRPRGLGQPPVALYAPLEFLGLLLAASAGLLPLVAGAGSALGGAAQGKSPLRSYVDALGPSLKAFGGAVAVILVAAVVESLVITSR